MVLIARAATITSQFLAISCASVPVLAQSEATGVRQIQPRLAWEREFDGKIIAAGVDRQRFNSTNGDISSCLKWILTDRGLMRISENESGIRELLRGSVDHSSVSPSGKYLLCTERREAHVTRKEEVHSCAFDWDGNLVWRTDERPAWLALRDDGSALFGYRTFAGRGELSPLKGAKWIDAQGRVIRRHDFGEKLYVWGGNWIAASDDFSAVAAVDSGRELRIFFFDKGGRCLWERDPAVRRASGGIAVSDQGEVLLPVIRTKPPDFTVFVFDQTGTLGDSVSVPPTGPLGAVRIFGNLAVVATYATGQDPSLLLCYDLRKRQTRFLIEGEVGRSFGYYDADADAGLVAAVVHVRGSCDSVGIYDLNGECRAQVSVSDEDTRNRGLWFRVLNGALLVAEGNSLRLYLIDGD